MDQIKSGWTHAVGYSWWLVNSFGGKAWYKEASPNYQFLLSSHLSFPFGLLMKNLLLQTFPFCLIVLLLIGCFIFSKKNWCAIISLCWPTKSRTVYYIVADSSLGPSCALLPPHGQSGSTVWSICLCSPMHLLYIPSIDFCYNLSKQFFSTAKKDEEKTADRRECLIKPYWPQPPGPSALSPESRHTLLVYPTMSPDLSASSHA